MTLFDPYEFGFHPSEGNSEMDHQVWLNTGEEETTMLPHIMGIPISTLNSNSRSKASSLRWSMSTILLQPLQPHLHCLDILQLDMEFVQGIELEERDADVVHKSERSDF
ncbi:unnamed protein product [Linum trigynum]|uniref:Uncharacterized protein n=1 Tax=Linum trigynum TaxID=586398 RepID=A0AAV2FSY7_9ROSI